MVCDILVVCWRCVCVGGGVSCAKLWWYAGSVCLSLGHRLKVCGGWCQ